MLLCGKYNFISSAPAQLHWQLIPHYVTFQVTTPVFNACRDDQTAYRMFCMTTHHLAVCVSSLRNFNLPTAAKFLSGNVHSYVAANLCHSLPGSRPNCYSLCTSKSKLEKPVKLNYLLLTVHTNHIVATAPMKSLVLLIGYQKIHLHT